MLKNVKTKADRFSKTLHAFWHCERQWNEIDPLTFTAVNSFKGNKGVENIEVVRQKVRKESGGRKTSPNLLPLPFARKLS